MLGRQFEEGLVHFRVDVRLCLDEIRVSGGDAGLDAVVDRRVEMRDVAVARQQIYERREVRTLKSVFIQISWMTIGSGDDDDSVLPKLAKQTFQDHCIRNVRHLGEGGGGGERVG